jgi:putative redox protein
MRIELARRNGAVHFTATTASGREIAIDGAPSVGGQNLGARPMELVLAALGGCSAIDVVEILRKQRQPLEDLRVTVDGERDPAATPALFRAIHVHFAVTGPCDPAKVSRAVALSMETYCSVARILEPTAAITHSHAVLPSPAPAAR